MSTSVRKDIHTTIQNDDWQPRPELIDAMRRIATIADGDETAVISDREITFENQGQRTTITAEKVDLETVDGLWISERIRICTPLTFFEHYSDEHLAIVNTFATTGALVRDPEAGDAIVSTLPVFEGDIEALAELYTPLIANGALLHVIGPLAAAHCISGTPDFGADWLALPAWDQQSLWGADDFEYANDRIRKQGFYANAGPSGLTAEFPWEEGASSAMLGDRTSLLQVRVDMPHPLAGNGLFYRLDLPVAFTADEAMRCAGELNRFEADGIDTPPFFGAWCCNSDSGTLSFVGFWPNLMYQFGTVANIAFWCLSRSRIARQVLGNR